jgi:hypothetical protein
MKSAVGVNRFVKGETVTKVPGLLTNPERIAPFSPGLPQRGYPGKEAPNHPTPTGLRLRVIAVVPWPSQNGETSRPKLRRFL